MRQAELSSAKGRTAFPGWVVAWLAADAVNRAFDVGDQPYQVLVQLAGNR
jgi:hypothetical protein